MEKETCDFRDSAASADAGRHRPGPGRLGPSAPADPAGTDASSAAAGTGSFLSSQAKRLDIPVEEFGPLALTSNNPTPIAARCTVFAESDLVHKAHELLKNCPEINFCGNIEGRDLLSGEFDVIVTDGFAGNVAMKSAESTINTFTAVLKQEIKSGGLGSKIGGLLLKNTFKKLKHRINYTEVGGSPFLGLEKILIKSHGSSKAKTIYTCVLQIMEIHKSNYIQNMREGIAKSNVIEGESDK